MTLDDAAGRIRALLAEAAQLPVSISSTEFNSWKPRAESVLTRALGRDHPITQQFMSIHWTPRVYGGDPLASDNAFTAAVARAQGTFDATLAEIELGGETSASDSSGIDPELWAHVAPEIQAQAWGKVASQAVIFTEDRIRKWAGRPVQEVGKELAIAVFGSSGQFQMGQTASETQGWQLLAQGIAQALRNVDAHRIQERPDHERYARGLLGACSLLSHRCVPSTAPGSETPHPPLATAHRFSGPHRRHYGVR